MAPPPWLRTRFFWVGSTVIFLLCFATFVHPFRTLLLRSHSFGGQRQLLLIGQQQNQPSDDTSTRTRSTTATATYNSVVTSPSFHSCTICNQGFYASRNDLFRHVRAAHSSDNPDNVVSQMPLRTQIAFLVAYYYTSASNGTTPPTTTSREGATSLSLTAGERIKKACLLALNHTEGASMTDFGGMTQSSVALQRHMSLSQDTNCASAGDVVVVNFKALTNDYIKPEFVDTLNTFVHQQEKEEPCQKLQILSAVEIPSTPSSSLHAEKSCTQLVYHYLLPLWWLTLDDCSNSPITNINEDIATWWDTINKGGEKAKQAQQRPPAAVLNLKKLLKDIRSKQVTAILEDGNDNDSYNKKRFGQLAKFEKKPFHNFADPALKGNASPNHDPIWRTLDQVKIVDFVPINDCHGSDNLAAVIEFRGDGFLTEQVRRLVGTIVAILNGWLPDNFFDLATRPDVVMLETPLAPDNHAYLALARFHYYELINNHGLFSYKKQQPRPNFLLTSSNTTIATTGVSYQQRQQLNTKRTEWTIVQKALLKLTDTSREKDWLCNLRDTVAPRIRVLLESAYSTQTEHQPISYNPDSASATTSVSHMINTSTSPTGTINNLSGVPSVYHDTLTSLRDIYSTGRWPATSIARSRIIVDASAGAANSSSLSKRVSGLGGSFTIINSNLLSDENGPMKSSYPIPKSNFLFPDLVRSVFELEKKITTTAEGGASWSRPPSTHCAINCNAQFTPHVDSGRGKGQSLSMIVSLGNFAGGRLYIESVTHDITYKPKEFDGWKLRHWTEAFEGERFSLVWFTPEIT